MKFELPSLAAAIAITRFDRPIGTFLVLWPTLWALWLAADGLPDWHLLVIFSLGALVMRSAGCIANDLADRHLDGHVTRTQERPLVTGKLSARQALNLLLVLLLLALVLVSLTSAATMLWSLGALILAGIYPFMKRYTQLPQLVLGAAFSWAIPMAFVAQTGQVPEQAWLLFCANLVWTMAYDTQYAMVDRDDDLKVGIKSTAILFGNADRAIIAGLQALFLVGLSFYGLGAQLGTYFWLGIALAGLHFGWQFRLTRTRERSVCFRAFLSNNYLGMLIFVAIAIDRLLA